MTSHSRARRVSSLASIIRSGAFLLALAGAQQLGFAQTAVVEGTISSFDVVNDTGKDAHGFEIQIEGAVPGDLYYTVPGGRYGQPTIVAAPAGLVVGTLLAAIYGTAVRTRGVYFILITIAMGYIVWGAAYRWASFTGGDNGITNVPAPAIGGWAIQSQTAYYYFVLAVTAACALGYGVLVRSPFGLALRGIKGSESRMRSLGYQTTAHLYAAFVLSGAMASLAGVLYVYYNRFVNPVAASFNISIDVALMAIVGGSGSIVGPFIGAGIILGMRNWVSSFFELHAAVMGMVFIATVLWAPTGVVGILNRVRGSGAGGEGKAP